MAMSVLLLTIQELDYRHQRRRYCARETGPGIEPLVFIPTLLSILHPSTAFKAA